MPRTPQEKIEPNESTIASGEPDAGELAKPGDAESPPRRRMANHDRWLLERAASIRLETRQQLVVGFDPSPGAHERLGDAFRAIGALEAARNEYQHRLLRENPKVLALARDLEAQGLFADALDAYHDAMEADEMARLVRRAISERVGELSAVVRLAAGYEKANDTPLVDLADSDILQLAAVACEIRDLELMRIAEDYVGVGRIEVHVLALGDAFLTDALRIHDVERSARGAADAYGRVGAKEKLVEAVERLWPLVVRESRGVRSRLSLEAWAYVVDRLADTHEAIGVPLPSSRLMRTVEDLLRFCDNAHEGPAWNAAAFLCQRIDERPE